MPGVGLMLWVLASAGELIALLTVSKTDPNKESIWSGLAGPSNRVQPSCAPKFKA